MACIKCGQQVPVLKSVANPQAQRFVGMCKACVKIEWEAVKSEQKATLSEILAKIFG